MTKIITCDVCVVGGGPAGLALALSLVSRGHEVVVVEKSRTFERSFRGESVSPDSVWLLHKLGVLDGLRRQRILDVRRIELVDAGKKVLGVSFDAFDKPVRYPVEVPQPMLLGELATVAGAHPGFRLLRQTRATDLLRGGQRVRGVRGETPDGPVEIRAKLTVGADGRYSKVREWAGLSYRKVPLERDFLWFTVRCPDDWSNDTYRVRISGNQHAMCIPTYPDLVRVGVNIPKNGLKASRASGIEGLHARIDELAPELSAHVRDQVRTWSDTSMLEIFTSVVPKWSTPGLILIGDAAHTLSPVLAQGVNHAIIDGVRLAPGISHALADPGTDDAIDRACAAFQRAREPHIERARAMQLRQEKLFALATPVAQAVRRALYRTVDRIPFAKRRIWGSLYYGLPQEGSTLPSSGRLPAVPAQSVRGK
ncbi:FAD-dependent oxidoreductase [Streptomyces rimosus]|uniref:FAD-dependent oxidoreductase n=1 Tax=Streptomyces rimosus TaxID=1927 RepID=UPI0004C7014E|nr:FAD-dependent oxidoreductase [Streptomyces rimosus]